METFSRLADKSVGKIQRILKKPVGVSLTTITCHIFPDKMSRDFDIKLKKRMSPGDLVDHVHKSEIRGCDWPIRRLKFDRSKCCKFWER